MKTIMRSRTSIPFSAALLGLLLVAASCRESTLLPEDQPQDNRTTAPDPIEIGSGVDIQDDDKTYYLLVSGPWSTEAKASADSLANALETGGIAVDTLWYPVQPTPCMAMTATTAAIVKLKGRDDRIVSRHGFITEPGYWIINCGVSNFLMYVYQ